MPAEAVAGRVAREQPSEPSDGEIDRLGTWQGAVASGISPASGREDWQVRLAMWPRSPHETSQDQPSSALCPRCVDALGLQERVAPQCPGIHWHLDARQDESARQRKPPRQGPAAQA